MQALRQILRLGESEVCTQNHQHKAGMIINTMQWRLGFCQEILLGFSEVRREDYPAEQATTCFGRSLSGSELRMSVFCCIHKLPMIADIQLTSDQLVTQVGQRVIPLADHKHHSFNISPDVALLARWVSPLSLSQRK